MLELSTWVLSTVLVPGRESGSISGTARAGCDECLRAEALNQNILKPSTSPMLFSTGVLTLQLKFYHTEFQGGREERLRSG